MTANITFLPADEPFDLDGSGVGFFGSAGFGAQVLVGEWQDRTFATNSNGTDQGAEMDNVKFTHPNSGQINTPESDLNLLDIPNFQSTLNIRFTNSTPVQTQNAELIIFDRLNTTSPASGVHCKVAEIIHPYVLATGMQGSGNDTWVDASSGIPGGPTPFIQNTLFMIDSPGTSGERPDGDSTTDEQHDWYVAISASPLSIGSKTNFGLHFSVEFL